MMSQYSPSSPITSKNGNILFLGDINSANDIKWLRKNNIRTVITAGKGLPVQYDASIRHYQYALLDKKQQNITKYFDQVVQNIEKSFKYGSILVHCGAGISRSTTLVMAYLISKQRMSFMEALKYVKEKRSGVCPNLGFEMQLKSYDALCNSSKIRLKNSYIQQHETENYCQSPVVEFQEEENLNFQKTKSAFMKNHDNPSRYRKYNLLLKKQLLKKKQPALDDPLVFPQIKGQDKHLHLRSLEITEKHTQRKNHSINFERKSEFMKDRKNFSGIHHEGNQQKIINTDYLKKIAQFRFGITNFNNWKIN